MRKVLECCGGSDDSRFGKSHMAACPTLRPAARSGGTSASVEKFNAYPRGFDNDILRKKNGVGRAFKTLGGALRAAQRAAKKASE